MVMADSEGARKLEAILGAHVGRYSRLMQHDDEAIVAALEDAAAPRSHCLGSNRSQSTNALRQLVQQRLRVFGFVRIEALCESAVDRAKELPRAIALVAPTARPAICMDQGVERGTVRTHFFAVTSPIGRGM